MRDNRARLRLSSTPSTWLYRIPTYSPNAQLFRQLAEPLAENSDVEKAAPLIRSLAAQQANIERVGPTAEYVRFVITLARSELQCDYDSARHRILDLYSYVRNRNGRAKK